MTGKGLMFSSTVLGLIFTTGCALKVVDVGAPAINCVFDSSCTVTVTDSTAPIPIPAGGTNFLQSRTFTGKPGAPVTRRITCGHS